jgi:hypothetical protein
MAVNSLTPLVIGGKLVGVNRPTYTLAKALAASTAEAFTVPSGAKFAMFAGESLYYINFTTTATVPGDVTDGSASLQMAAGLPMIFSLEGATSISVISAYACVITASFYK